MRDHNWFVTKRLRRYQRACSPAAGRPGLHTGRSEPSDSSRATRLIRRSAERRWTRLARLCHHVRRGVAHVLTTLRSDPAWLGRQAHHVTLPGLASDSFSFFGSTVSAISCAIRVAHLGVSRRRCGSDRAQAEIPPSATQFFVPLPAMVRPVACAGPLCHVMAGAPDLTSPQPPGMIAGRGES